MIRKLFRYLLYIILFLLLIFSGLYLYTNHYLETKIKTPKLLFIPKGHTKTIIKNFQKEGIDLHWFDYYLIKMRGYPQAGWIELGEQNLTREVFFEKITHARAALQNITLIPGETNVIFLENLSKSLDLNKTKLTHFYKEYAPYEDGVILAETYKVARGIDEKELMKFLVNSSLDKHRKMAQEAFGSYHAKQWFEEVISKASIIQKEAANRAEMPLVSAVISNRLTKGMKLQMDGTLNYGKFSHVRVTAQKIRTDKSKFNTYKYAGLPPSPFCAVSKDAITAALHPAKVDYLYFVKGKSGKHIFTNSYKEHLKHVK